MQKRLVDFILARPKLTLGLFVFVTFLVSLGALSLKPDFTYKVWHNNHDPLMRLYERFEANFGNDDSVVIGLVLPDGVFTRENVELIQMIADELYQVSDIIRVDTPLNFHHISAQGDDIDIRPILAEEDVPHVGPEELSEARETALSNDILVGSLINEDATFAVIQGQARPAFDEALDSALITAQVKNILSEVQTSRPEIKTFATGPIILTDAFREATVEDMTLLIPLLYAIFTLLLLYLFRSFAGVVLPYLAVGASTALMLGTMGYFGMSLNTLTSLAPTILLTIALADAIHVLTVYHLGLKNGMPQTQALRRSLNKNFYPTLLTSVTTALGFLSFFNAQVAPVAQMGIAVGLGALYAWFATYFFMAPLMALWKSKKREDSSSFPLEEKDIPPGPRALAFAGFVQRRAASILLVTAALSGASLWLCKDLVVNMDPVEQFSSEHPVSVAYNTIEEKLGFSAPIEIFIDSEAVEGAKNPDFLKKLEEFETWLASRPYVESSLSINDYLKTINQAFHAGEPEFYSIPPTAEHVAQELFFYSMGLPPEMPLENRINAARDAVRVTVNWKPRSSNESNDKFALINDKAEELGLNAQVTGKTPLFHNLTPYIVSTFGFSLSLALVTIGLSVILVMRSIKLGFFALFPSVLPLILWAGVFSLSGNDMDMGTALVASVCLGIAVDDSIHFLFAYRRQKGAKSFQDNLASIVTNVFPSLFNTTVLLVVGFSSFLLGSYIPNAKFGASVALALTLALACDFLVLPALLVVFDKKKPLK